MDIKEEYVIELELLRLHVLEIDCSRIFIENIGMDEKQENILLDLEKILKLLIEEEIESSTLINLSIEKLVFPISLWNEILHIAIERTRFPWSVKLFISEQTTQDKQKYVIQNNTLRRFIVNTSFLDSEKMDADELSIDYENILRLTLLRYFEDNKITNENEMSNILKQFHNLEDLLKFTCPL